jgi:hypothetical protein
MGFGGADGVGGPHKHRQAEFVFATEDQSDPEVESIPSRVY